MLLPRQSQNNCYCRNIQWGLVSGLDKAILREATWSISKIRVSGGIGGGISAAGDQLLVSIRETVFQRSLPLATRDLEIRLGEATDRMGLIGATEMVISEIFKPESLKQWINLSTEPIQEFDAGDEECARACVGARQTCSQKR